MVPDSWQICLSCVFRVRTENHASKASRKNICLAVKKWGKGPWLLATAIAAAVAALVWMHHGAISVSTTAGGKQTKHLREGWQSAFSSHYAVFPHLPRGTPVLEANLLRIIRKTSRKAARKDGNPLIKHFTSLHAWNSQAVMGTQTRQNPNCKQLIYYL